MEHASKGLEFLLALAKADAVVTRKLDAKLGGIGFTEFQILFLLSQAEGEKMRRTDLAEQVGLTASGITRLLLPMEKIGLVKKETDANDGRVSHVVLARGGKQKLEEGLERAEVYVSEIIPNSKSKKVEELAQLLQDLVG